MSLVTSGHHSEEGKNPPGGSPLLDLGTALLDLLLEVEQPKPAWIKALHNLLSLHDTF